MTLAGECSIITGATLGVGAGIARDRSGVGEAPRVSLIGTIHLMPDKTNCAAFPQGSGIGIIARDFSVNTGLILRAARSRMRVSPPVGPTPAEVNELNELNEMASLTPLPTLAHLCNSGLMT